MGRIRYLLPLFAVCLCGACDFNLWKFGFTDYAVDDRFEDSMGINEVNPPADLIVGGHEYLLAFASDLHITSTAEKIMPLFAALDEKRPLAVIYNGDLYNGRPEYADVAQKVLEGESRFPHYYVCGNHDQYFGWLNYLERFGSSTYSFVIRGSDFQDLFIVLESGSSTLGEKQYKWLENLLKTRDDFRYCFISTHSNLNIHSFNFGTYGEDELHTLYRLFADNRVTAVITGHSHVSDDKTILGVRYLNTAAAKNGHYGLLTVGTEIIFEPVSF